MPERKAETDEPQEPPSHADVEEILLDSSGEVLVSVEDSLPTPPKDKRIHPRRPLPQVPKAKRGGKTDKP